MNEAKGAAVVTHIGLGWKGLPCDAPDKELECLPLISLSSLMYIGWLALQVFPT
jgi:hypothetical protein